jgi:hypothetical protein
MKPKVLLDVWTNQNPWTDYDFIKNWNWRVLTETNTHSTLVNKPFWKFKWNWHNWHYTNKNESSHVSITSVTHNHQLSYSLLLPSLPAKRQIDPEVDNNQSMTLMKSWYSQLRKPEQGLNFSFEVKESLPVKDFQHQEEGTNTEGLN